MRRREQSADKTVVRRQAPIAVKKRTRPLEFAKEVRQELKKVVWPSRKELGTYAVVVIIAILVLMSIVFVLDLVFAKAVLFVFKGGRA